MPVTVQSLRTTPYQVGNFTAPIAVVHPPPNSHTGPVKYRNEHVIYPTPSGRVRKASSAQLNLKQQPMCRSTEDSSADDEAPGSTGHANDCPQSVSQAQSMRGRKASRSF